MLALLQRDAELREVAAIVGPEALEDADRLTLAGAAAVRELVLGQSAFDAEDAVCAARQDRSRSRRPRSSSSHAPARRSRAARRSRSST